MRKTDLNKAGHFCVASSEILWVLMEKRWREVKGRESYSGDRVERGSLVRAEAQSCIQWGKAAPAPTLLQSWTPRVHE